LYDTVIKGGTIVEGTGLPRFNGDIGIKNGHIAKIGKIDRADGDQVLEADGLIVAPGFVDLHTHYDAQLHWDPYCTISGWHGVTSVAIGNCGFGFAPAKPDMRERLFLMMTRTEQIPYDSMVEGLGLDWDWESLPEWMDHLENVPKGVNVLNYVPLNPLMIYVMGLERAKSGVAATDEERAEMQRLVNEAMDAGMMGIAAQRLGENSVQADHDGTPMPTDCMADEDFLALASVLADRGEGFIQVTEAKHLNPSDPDPEADWRFVEKLAEVSQRPILYNAVIAVDHSPKAHTKALEWLADCNRRGLRVFGQGVTVRSPFQFTLEHWNLYDSSPAWNEATQGSHDERMAKLADPDVRKRMIEEHPSLITTGVGGPIKFLTVQETPDHPELQKYVGRTVGDIALDEGKHPIEAMLDIAVAGDLKVLFLSQDLASTDHVKVGELSRDQHVIPGISDGGAHTKFFTGGSYPTDMLTWLVRDTGEMTLEDAHYHLSYLPAQAAGFVDRGFLREGAPADIVVYDLENLKRVPEIDYEVAYDFPANEWRRIQRAEGYRWIMVNGTVTFKDGECTGKTPGHLIRLNQWHTARMAAE
ncbi:MAG: amidohydrolase family protein, partial [Rhodospirillales bacterium]|nr:amidohydrolase family protein [Rhodospirillales bacterium]